jgi:uroporphyrinogen decarboxylase
VTKELKCGERFVRCLTGGDIDKVPFGAGLGWNPWGETLEKWREETGRPGLSPAEEFGYEKSFAIPKTEPGIFPCFEEKILESDNEHTVMTDRRGITLRARKDGGSMPEFLSYPVETPEDWERLKEERLKADDAGRVTENWDEFRSRLKATGESAQLGDYPWGVFGAARDILGVERLLLGMMDEPAMIKDIMTHLTSLWLQGSRMKTRVDFQKVNIRRAYILSF